MLRTRDQMLELVLAAFWLEDLSAAERLVIANARDWLEGWPGFISHDHEARIERIAERCARMRGKFIRFVLLMPDRNDKQFKLTKTRRSSRSDDSAYKAWEQACRQRWRALALVVKAKLEAVESGISTFEEEFLANIMLPNNQTVGQYVLPQVEIAYETGQMPALLPGLGETGK